MNLVPIKFEFDYAAGNLGSKRPHGNATRDKTKNFGHSR